MRRLVASSSPAVRTSSADRRRTTSADGIEGTGDHLLERAASSSARRPQRGLGQRVEQRGFAARSVAEEGAAVAGQFDLARMGDDELDAGAVDGALEMQIQDRQLFAGVDAEEYDAVHVRVWPILRLHHVRQGGQAGGQGGDIARRRGGRYCSCR